jgi:hypothetical protein
MLLEFPDNGGARVKFGNYSVQEGLRLDRLGAERDD